MLNISCHLLNTVLKVEKGTVVWVQNGSKLSVVHPRDGGAAGNFSCSASRESRSPAWGKIKSPSTVSDVRAIWLRHLSPYWSPGLMWLIWLAGRVSPSSLAAWRAPLPKLHAWPKRTTIPNRAGPIFGQRYTSSYSPPLEPPNKLPSTVSTECV